MFFRSAVRALPVLMAVFMFAGAAYAQKAPDQPAKIYAPVPAPNADTDPESFVPLRLHLADNVWLQPHFFGCAQIGSYSTWDTDNAKKTEDDAYWSKSFLIRNARASLDVQLTKYASLFWQSDDFTMNAQYRSGIVRSYGRKSNSAYTQDAYLHLCPLRQLQLYAGLLTVPFNRASLTSDAGLLGTDMTAMHPEFGSLSRSGRDTGVMLRGFLVKSIIEYRVGVFRGMQKQSMTDTKGTSVTTDDVKYTRNDNGSLRYTARFQFSAMDGEDGYFYSENYLLKRQIFGVGFGLDYQPDVQYKHNNKDYIGWSIDAPLNMQMSAMYVLTGQINVSSTSNTPDCAGRDYTGFFNLNLQAGMLIAETWEPIAKYTYTNLKGTSRQYKTLTVGGNYYIDGNRLNIKSSISMPIGRNKHYADEWKAVLQLQGYL